MGLEIPLKESYSNRKIVKTSKDIQEGMVELCIKKFRKFHIIRSNGVMSKVSFEYNR